MQLKGRDVWLAAQTTPELVSVHFAPPQDHDNSTPSCIETSYMAESWYQVTRLTANPSSFIMRGPNLSPPFLRNEYTRSALRIDQHFGSTSTSALFRQLTLNGLVGGLAEVWLS